MENQGILKLSRPLMVNGKARDEILYDFDALTVEDILSLGKGRAAAGLGMVVTQELDPFAQYALFVKAAIRADGSLDEADMKRLSARDALKAQKLGRDFFFGDETEEDSAGEPNEISERSSEM